jgi:hypothetical protein
MPQSLAPTSGRPCHRTAGQSLSRAWLVLGVSIVLFATACGKTPLGTEAYSLAVALDRVFEKQDPAQLEQARNLIRGQADSGELTGDEAKALSELVDIAGDQRWDEARGKLRTLLTAQTRW